MYMYMYVLALVPNSLSQLFYVAHTRKLGGRGGHRITHKVIVPKIMHCPLINLQY